jgi:hypothetical protein
MNLSDYFESVRGLGVLATANSKGEVDVAIYARPHVVDENTIAFIMCERLSHENLKSNPHAAYIFVEQGKGYVGKRLYLTKVREETDTAVIDSLRRREPKTYSAENAKRYAVYFHINKVRPLVGD